MGSAKWRPNSQTRQQPSAFVSLVLPARGVNTADQCLPAIFPVNTNRFSFWVFAGTSSLSGSSHRPWASPTHSCWLACFWTAFWGQRHPELPVDNRAVENQLLTCPKRRLAIFFWTVVIKIPELFLTWSHFVAMVQKYFFVLFIKVDHKLHFTSHNCSLSQPLGG